MGGKTLVDYRFNTSYQRKTQMTRLFKVIKSVKRKNSKRSVVKRISDLKVKGNGWYISNGEFYEV